ncbi:ATP-binding cassette long-chain fatty acid transporter pxa2 [Coemansia sp. RSA 1939]|nr:ATP-binding cassette long-chain fatty acid transporter pxa2 [Coemansia sp. RSA 1939]KAJ2611671.1 ATP-binding cassette long-chain fatty acid transporter pxa2 [Coemansia sp. RSA 1804]
MADDDGGGDTAATGFLGLRVLSSSSQAPQTAQTAEAPQRIESAEVIEFDDVNIEQTRGGQQETHFAGLRLRIERGHHSVVVGGSTERRRALKAVLLGTSAATVAMTRGRLRSPKPHSGIQGVDARPYIRAGSSLWELLIFPHDKMQSVRRGVSERHLLAVLQFMDCEALLADHADDDWAKVVDWAKVLKRSELLAVSVCRMVYHAPPFALVDDALGALTQSQTRQMFAAARLHHVTLVVLAAHDPFGALPLPQSPPAAAADARALAASIDEFARALRLSSSSSSSSESEDDCAQAAIPWSFCVFGYGSAERPAFDVAEERAWVWNSAYAALASEKSYVSRLQRRTSTLSQCSTTERHWLMMTPDSALSPSSPFASDSLSRRQSPALTARSSVSDFSASTLRQRPSSDLLLLPPPRASLSSRTLATIDSALAGFVSPPPQPASKSKSESESQPPAAGKLEKPDREEETHREVEARKEEQPPHEEEEKVRNAEEENEEERNPDEEQQPIVPADSDSVSCRSVETADSREETFASAAAAAADTDDSSTSQRLGTVARQAPVRNPYARSGRAYARSPRSQFGQTPRSPPLQQQQNQQQNQQMAAGPSFIPPAYSRASNGARSFRRSDRTPLVRAASSASAASSRIPRPRALGSAASSKSSYSSDSAASASASASASSAHDPRLSVAPSSVEELVDSLARL